MDYLSFTESKNKMEKSLKTIYLYITFGCNQKCQYCWIHNNLSCPDKKMPVTMVETAISEGILLGLERVKITGGEPFINPDLASIVNLLLNKGLKVDIETNGTLINSQWIDSISKVENLFFKISLDAATSEIHDSLAQSEVFERTIKNIHLLSERSIKYGIVTVLNHTNVNQLEDIITFASNLGAVSHRIILNIQPIGRGKNVDDIKLNLNETIDVIDRFYQLNEQYKRIELGTLHTTLPPAFIPLDNLNFKSCDWGVGLCGIMPNGDVTMCSPAFNDMNLVAGNLYETKLTDIWNYSSIFDEKAIEFNLEGVCSKCLFSKICRGMCRIFAKATYGSENAPYPFCQEMYETGIFPPWSLNKEESKKTD